MYFFLALIENYCNLVCFYIKNNTKMKVFSHIFGPNFVTLCMFLLFNYPIQLNFKNFSIKTAKKIQIFFSIDMELSEFVHFLFHSFPAYLLLYLRLALLSNFLKLIMTSISFDSKIVVVFCSFVFPAFMLVVFWSASF